jgi:Fe-Mn family superoxide dismutase
MAVQTAPTYQEKALKPNTLEMQGISRKTMEEHFKLYQGYVKKANEILQKLPSVDLDPTKANQTYSDIRELKLELSFAVGGIKNHELYFGHLGGNGQPSGKAEQILQKYFGGYEKWAQDLKATGIAARGWVWLAYDWDANTYFNYLGDAQNTFPIWNGTPIVALDTYEHAYFIDYGTARAQYIDAFMKVLDWNVVNETIEHFQLPV